MASNNEHQDIKLCDQCSRKVARRTVNNKDVISALSSVVKEIVNTMSNTIITKNMRQTIQSTTNDDQALGHLRDALSKSLDPHMVDEVIRVLFDKEMEGEAKIIKDIYNYEISKQGQCENCRKGSRSDKVEKQAPTSSMQQAVSSSAGSQEVLETTPNIESKVISSAGMGTLYVKPMDPSLIEELQRDKGVYKVARQIRGTALIINMRSVSGEHERLGSEHDVTKLQDLFRQLHFEPNVHEDLTQEEMKKVLKNEWEKQSTMDPDAFILCIMSHGCRIDNKDYICCSDGPKLEVDSDICGPLGLCGGLKRKPKIVIIQACRSEPPSEVDKSTSPSDKADMLIAFSTVADCDSYRRPNKGSYFIQTIVRVIAEEAHRSHIVDMLTKVRQEVRKEPKAQLTEDTQRLEKKFYFFPGYI